MDPTFAFERESLVAAPVAQVFAFHTDPQNLILITPTEYQLRLIQAPDPIQTGSLVIFEIALLGPLVLPWLSRITELVADSHFTDVQAWGPFSHYRHTHRFIAAQGGTLLRDTVMYTPPLGWWGLATELWVRPRLEALFDYRHRKTQELCVGASEPI
ncbi:SRPBCC family protein [Candidatus Cyanaurora vandensis]|uniref:SRPBCC family protein n=1 Tax=Candidatus Cyanaurora vandensis TaxID=2714958 RepID=UPI00257E0B92|nr:SRPBCC family protein [Candidatus Cyanaurora vandensis]